MVVINSVVGVANPSGNDDVSNTSDDPTTNQANDPTVVVTLVLQLL